MYRHIETNRRFKLHSEIRQAFPQIDFPQAITEEFLTSNGFEILPFGKTLDELKTDKLQQITAAAIDRFVELDWRATRAKERETLEVLGETYAEVLREREAVRAASNRLESVIEASTDPAEVFGLQFILEESDWPPAKRLISQYKFRQRFTLAEKLAITEARETDATLEVIMGDMDAASQLDLDNPGLVQGAQYIEQAGLIAAGRAAEILGDIA